MGGIVDIDGLLEKKQKEVNDIIESFLPEESGHQKTVYEAMNYSVRAGGKRLRPLLMREFFYLFGGSTDRHLIRCLHRFMTAIEMIHSYSLVHDDLPAMDDDDMRRGMPSTHKKFGEAMGILAGDALLNGAFEQIAEAMEEIQAIDESTQNNICSAADQILMAEQNSGLHGENPSRAELMRRISAAFCDLVHAAGASGMIGGQVVDIENSGNISTKENDEKKLLFMYEGKTCALISTAFVCGAVLAGADDQSIKAVKKAGNDIGMAFQIRDDILDITGDEKTLGKPVHSDEEQGKTTYVSIYGLEKSEQAVKAYTDSALECLTKLKPDTISERTLEFLRGLFLKMVDRNS
ncbi:MAG: polyprenyl synthetase family protein [Eubacterium sp.]|nr:polyprenyl synthetase family protein [Eubacterium sp.]